MAALILLAVPALAQPGPATALYRRLSSAGLDRHAIYSIRDGAIDRQDIHISFNDGVIGLTESIEGEVTGALFIGEGEVLVVPPDLTERQSLALFTGSPVLSERFTVAYFRFHDARFVRDLEPALRRGSEGDAAGFFDKYNSVARSLAEADALRLLEAITHAPAAAAEDSSDSSEFLRARITGVHLGTFDMVLDNIAVEQVFLGQVSSTGKGTFYDQWAQFPMRAARTVVAAKTSEVAKNVTAAARADGSARGERFTIRDYRIRAQALPPSRISAETSLELEARVSGERTVIFELSRYLRLSSVTIAGSTDAVEVIQNEALEGSQLARRGNDLVALVFPRPLNAGERRTLVFRYAGDVMSEAGGGLMYVGARGTWYPNRGPAMADFDLEFRYPAGWKLLATGRRIAQRNQGSEEISQWKTERPIPLAGFNLGKYTQASAQAGPVVVESYASRAMEASFTRALLPAPAPPAPLRPGMHRGVPDVEIQAPPPQPAAQAQAVADQAARTIEFLAPRLGPFPYSSLSLTQMPGTDSQGWPGLVFLSSYVFLTPQQRWQGRTDSNAPVEILYARIMAAHETAHQWWGDAVFWRSYRDQWLMEALANYCALLQIEQESPQQFQIVLDHYRDELLVESETSHRPMKDAGAVVLGQRLNSSRFFAAYDVVAYGRGTWLLHMLRHMLRDAARESPQPPSSADPDALFLSLLRQLQTRYSGKPLSTADLRQVLEASLPRSLWFEGHASLDWFFSGWVGGTDIPHLELSGVKIARGAGTATASAVLRQKKASELLVTSVPIYAEMPDGSLRFVERVFADGEETALKLTVPAGARRLVLDPFHTVLRER